jgi:UDP-2,3-diacylglucosamine hydrolase
LSERREARPLAILCGGGVFPLEVARAAQANGRPPFIVGIVGSSDPAIETFPHVWVHMGQVGKMFAALRDRAIADIAIVGAMTRPEFADLRFDWGALKRAPELARLFRGGDNRLLVGIAAIFEREGLRVVGAHEIAPQLLAPAGLIGARAAPSEAEADARIGAALLVALSPFDAGQGVVVANARVIAIEAAEGTDAMLARVADLRASRRLRFQGPTGVFVKGPKRDQDLRLDMPAVGPKTIEAAQRAQLQGVALAAGQVLIADRPAFSRAADEAGLFVIGIAPDVAS